jgi:hypothetical protein
LHLTVRISPGELLDKLTILEIKAERVHGDGKRKNVLHELESLRRDWNAAGSSRPEVEPLMAALRAVNESLWEIEDRIRQKEAKQEFDDEFIALARSVYQTNDRRAALKRAVNEALGSDLIEEKSYGGEAGPGEGPA